MIDAYLVSDDEHLYGWADGQEPSYCQNYKGWYKEAALDMPAFDQKGHGVQTHYYELNTYDGETLCWEDVEIINMHFVFLFDFILDRNLFIIC